MATTTITFTIDNSVISRVETALCTRANLPITALNAKKALINTIMAIVSNYEAQQATLAASQTAISNVNSQIVIS